VSAVVLAVPESEDHARKLADRLGAELIAPHVHVFPDGEISVRIPEEVAGRDVVICGSLYPRPADKFLLVAFLAATARELGARRVGLVAPYLAFMRQDERFHPGDGVSARYFAALVSKSVDWMVTVDPHLHRIHSLDGLYTIPTTVARSASVIGAWIRSEVAQPVLVGPDAESVQWVAAVADACGAPFVVLEKTRRGDRDVSITQPVAPGGSWAGRTPVVIDDIVSTGRTMLEAVRELGTAGAAAPVCVAIHAVFADAVQGDLMAAGAQRVVSCNTIAHASNAICVADAIAAATRGYLAIEPTRLDT
jgi:ribose-phosphate pyrophosphokinase